MRFEVCIGLGGQVYNINTDFLIFPVIVYIKAVYFKERTQQVG